MKKKPVIPVPFSTLYSHRSVPFLFYYGDEDKEWISGLFMTGGTISLSSGPSILDQIGPFLPYNLIKELWTDDERLVPVTQSSITTWHVFLTVFHVSAKNGYR